MKGFLTHRTDTRILKLGFYNGNPLQVFIRFFKMELNYLLDLLNTEFTIIDNGLFVVETQEAKKLQDRWLAFTDEMAKLI